MASTGRASRPLTCTNLARAWESSRGARNKWAAPIRPLTFRPAERAGWLAGWRLLASPFEYRSVCSEVAPYLLARISWLVSSRAAEER